VSLLTEPPSLPIAESRRRRALWLFGGIAVVAFAVLSAIDLRLMEGGAPGIVPFEVAFSSERAREVLDEWGSEGRAFAVASLLVDYVFILGWALFLSLACILAAARQRAGRLARLGAAGAWAALLAGLCDALEDAALLGVIASDGDRPLPLVAGIFASAKFLLLGMTLLYLVVALIAARRAHRHAA
jgi:hypothetical protein